MENKLDIQDIFNYLPHRPPFLLIDRVIEVIPLKSLTAIKNVTVNEWFFAGHFPHHPIMPGVLILEALAQSAAVLAFKSMSSQPNPGTLYLFAGIDRVRFRRIVQPGDVLTLKVEFLNFRANAIKVLGTATVEHELVCTSELMSIKKGE